jgi:hypothetical protein
MHRLGIIGNIIYDISYINAQRSVYYSTIQCSTVQYSAAQYSKVQHINSSND